jgi:hypothetical protein
MKLKFWYKVKATYNARKNAKSATVKTTKVRAYAVIEAIQKAANDLKLTGKPVQWQIVSINNTPFKYIGI